MPTRPTCLVTFLTAISQAALAQAIDPGTPGDSIHILDEVTVTGAAGGIDNIAGSATYLAPEDLETQAQSDVLRILRAVPGVNIQEEEGFGLRPNIGLRGSGSDRSARIALMEDGIPIAPAAYASPSAYYFPSAQRIHAIEVTKGPAVIRYGPRTSGGAINLLSTPIPEADAAYAQAFFGDFERQQIHAWAGTRRDVTNDLAIGGLLEVFTDKSSGFKQLDNGGDTGFDVDDIVAKIGFYAEQGAYPWSLELKYQSRSETSDQTYLGLTDADFAVAPNRLYDAASEDEFTSENEVFQLTHKLDFTPALSVTTLIYRTNFTRNWYKLEGINPAGMGASGDISIASILADRMTFTTELDLLRGATSLDDSLVVRANKRAYYGQGIQSVLNFDTSLIGATHDLTLGVRYHEDQEDRFQKEDAFRLEGGVMALTTSGAAGSQTNRVSDAKALAVFVEDRVRLGRFQITGGLRFEDYELVRDDFSLADPSRSSGPVRTRRNSDQVFLPALSGLYDVTDTLTLLAGLHRGFAIPTPGNTSSSDEKSVNYEAGGRYSNGALRVEAIAYYNDYANLLGTVTGSTGGNGIIGDQFDGGDVNVLGLEATLAWDAADMLHAGNISLPVSVVYTYTDAEFQTSFASDFGPWDNVVAGDKLPYVPAHQVTVSGGINASRWGLNAVANYVVATRAIAGQGTIPGNQLIDSRWVVDVAAYIGITDELRLRVKAENLFNETYIASRRPAGLRPGKPQEILFGFELRF